MKNFIFISPNFPTNFWKFCRELKNNGLNVLGIGDQPYDQLSADLKDSLNEYYKVGNLENYDEVYRAVAFFAFKHGKIDWLESNNEYWLEKDAMLRQEFNICSGFKPAELEDAKYKSRMKQHYIDCNIPVARYHLVEGYEDCVQFIRKVHYPVIAKPDNGVGASDTWKIRNNEQLKEFLEKKLPGKTYIMEEFVNGVVNSYDAVVDSQGNPIFETGNVTPISIMDIVNDNDNSLFYIRKDLPEDVRNYGRAVVKSFNVKNRFVHFEFFRLTEDQPSLGKKGDVIGLEVNMRPSGGVTPDMISLAHNVNIYKVWADMIAYDSSLAAESGKHSFCGFAGRRDGKTFKYSHEDLYNKYADAIKVSNRVDEALSGAMGNQMYLATFDTEEELNLFYKDVIEEI